MEKKLKKSSNKEFTLFQRSYCEGGIVSIVLRNREPKPQTEDEERAWWESYKSSGFVEEYSLKNPGKRPKLFWKYEVQEGPQQIGEGSYVTGFHETHYVVHPIFETEFQTLKRLGLLFEHETEDNRKIALELETQANSLRLHGERVKSLPAEKFITSVGAS